MSEQDLIAIGRVGTTHGLRGELRVQLFNPDSTAIQPGAEVVLRRHDRETRRQVRSVRPHKRLLLVIFVDCASIEDAEGLVGSDVCVAKDDLPPVGAGEIYHFELVGMAVVTTTGEDLGTVAEVLAVSSNDICVVRNGPREYLIPMIADVIKQVDRERRRLVIEPLPGLLD
jgi:16S rRNA processing protein RimM